VNGSRVIQLARLGDLLQSLPLVKALRGSGPVELVLAFDPGRRLGAEADRVRVVEPWSLARATSRPALFMHRLVDALGGLATLRQPVDLQICLNEDPAATGLARLLPAGVKRGAGVAGDAYSRWLRLTGEDRLSNSLLLAEAMLCCLPGTSVRPPVVGEPGDGDVVLHPGSGSPARRLSHAFWTDLARHLLDALPERRLLITGGLLEKTGCEELEAAIGRPDRVLSLAGRLDLDELQDQLESAALVVAQDTGVLHLAAHLRRPVLGLYHGSASARETAPWLEGAQVLQAEAPCAPCVEGRPTCVDWACREQLRPVHVAAVAASLLRGGASPPAPAGCSHLVCCRHGSGLMLRPASAAAGPEPGAVSRQSALTRDLAQGLCERDFSMAVDLERAAQAGMSTSEWRRRHWSEPPRPVEERWHWLAATRLEEPSCRC
jgi:hypothetical protein